MYPNLYYIFKDLFGVEWNWLKLINTFGFFVACAFLVCAWVLTLELRRKERQGLLTYTEKEIQVGAPASVGELLLNFILGYVFGFKILGAFFLPGALNDPQAFILSGQGSVLWGVVLGGFFAGLKWWEKNKQKLAKPEARTIRIWPHDRVGDIVIYAAIFGFAGAKIFNSFETWDDFVKDPIGSLISFSGLTFYGGLICATIAIAYYAKRHNIKIIHLADTMAPVMMLAYGLGRIGCQVAGDGDWGILNSAFISDASGHLIPATKEQFNMALQNNQFFYIKQFGSLDAVHHLSVQPFWGLPNWMFAYNYPHNVINEGVNTVGCAGQYCSHLPISVFPTPLYEIIMCVILFFVLWSLRTRLKLAGQMTGLYLILNGLERFFIEKIRVNSKYEGLPFQPTQAEIISSLLVIGGVVLLWYASKAKIKPGQSLS